MERSHELSVLRPGVEAMGTVALITADQLLRMPGAADRSASDIETLTVGSELDGGDLLPGFRCPIIGVFVNP